MWRVLGRIMKKEFMQIFRDKRMFAIIAIVPLVQTTVFGFAVNLDLSAQPLVVSDRDRSPQSRALLEALAAVDSFRIVRHTRSEREAEEAVLYGKASLALLIPKGYARDQARGTATLMLIADGSDSNTALRAGQELSQVFNARLWADTRGLIRGAIAASGRSPDQLLPSIAFASRAWFNPTLRSAVFFVPGVLGMVLTVITMLLTSLGLTREKEIGTLEQIMVTPIRPWQLIVGKTLPFALLGLIDVLVIVVAQALIFQIPTVGSIAGLLGVSALFLLTTLGAGLFISTISSTQQQAMMSGFFLIVPAIMLSGFIFPIANMPRPVQWLTLINPLRYYLLLVRGIIIKGASPAELPEATLMLAALGLAVLFAATRRFRKRLA